MKPSANASKKSVAAVLRGMPSVNMIGRTIEPTMMIAPKPVREVNKNATAAHSASASSAGRSPPNSAAYETIVSAMPVASVTRESSAPKITVTITGASRTLPSTIVVCKPASPAPATAAMPSAISGTASSAGSTRAYIRAAASAKIASIPRPARPVKEWSPPAVRCRASRRTAGVFSSPDSRGTRRR